MKIHNTLLLAPFPALFDALSVVSLLFVVSKLVQQATREFFTPAAVPVALILTARFDRTCISPEWLLYTAAAPAAHLFPVSALTALQPTS